MKNTIVLIMFLVAVSTGFAELFMDVEVGGVDYDGEVLAAGTEVTVKVIQDVPNLSGVGGKITVDVLGTPGTAVGIPEPAVPYSGWNWMLAGTMDFIGNQAYFEVAADPYYRIYGTPGIGSILGLPDQDKGVAYEQTFLFTFFASETQLLSINAWWDTVYYGLGAEEIEVSELIIVPEPTTICLLGFGGLLLRRRRS